MNAEILCVGTEILLGDIVNTNAAYIARELAHMGFNVYHHTAVGDNADRLKQCLEIAFGRCDFVFMTGGLGPTYDDLTKETVAAYFGRDMRMDEDCLAELVRNFERFGRPMTDNNRKQAEMPEGAIVLHNPFGTAPGCIVEGNGKAAILMPGPPREMKPMFDGPVRDYLSRYIDGMLVSRNINLFGVGESFVEDRLRPMMEGLTNPTVAPYAGRGELRLRVTAKAETEEAGYRLIGPVVSDILEIFGDNIYGLDARSLEDEAVKLLSRRGKTLSVAESCTGGLVSYRLTDIPGVSEVYMGGICTYSNKSKMDMLGVKAETLEQYGAVSRETAEEMARGALKHFGTDMAVSTTGIAGPGGGGEEKPVGLVYVGLATREGHVEVRELRLARGRSDDRDNIRFSASSNALDMVIRALKGQGATTGG